MKRFLYSLFLVLLSVVALTSCENAEDVSYDKLIGTWYFGEQEVTLMCSLEMTEHAVP